MKETKPDVASGPAVADAGLATSPTQPLRLQQISAAWRPSPAKSGAAMVIAAVAMTMSFGPAQAQSLNDPSQQTPTAPGAAPPQTPDPQAGGEDFALLGQSTFTLQGDAPFHSPFRGPNSLAAGGEARETFDATLYAGARLWKGAEVWIDPEIDQGFGLSDTLGLAGFSSGEAYKVGASEPYVQVQRAFVHQEIDLGGAPQTVEVGQNQLSNRYIANRIVLWFGKMSVGDVFDNNPYTVDPRSYFLNWSIINAGTFDYAANAWGYTYGTAAEWYQGDWAVRLGAYDMSKDPNGARPDDTFTEYQLIAELERRYTLGPRAGTFKVTAFDSRARMGDFADAVRLAEATGEAPNVLLVRRYHGHAGLSYNWSQQVTDDLGLFSRAGYADGHQQSYEFTDVDRTFSVGAALTGKRWSRPDDTVGAAFVANGISRAFQTYLNDGGLGILIGDGKLPHPGSEHILETYYSYALNTFCNITADYQLADNPAYNTDRGPVSIFALRLHLQGPLLTGKLWTR
jgi:high affinity Mn2+ porin